ncbi:MULTISPECIES: homogentisate 1,2-dioxygenase [unclassified Crossiella]|uniref:homogentisate 1,2-dioxygenase n=1 Tax=unclassified Crossiella TaxID=2620835 RepID=UPI001FFFEA56|nr:MULTISPECIES: homogentisate 1,2-dioxygenase domain-containing protein [unclassified Crossiella]MCK2244621.1 homogentisate 1,2-dioxygenase [Crossiella sp. S99.2]MCK2258392.1 homogentisate 1,2-dioxygenase [Crossiella sp. S99.1]
MPHYRTVGEVPPKRHTQFRAPDGRLYHEELVGEEGFSSDSSLLYHKEIPSAIVDASTWSLPDLSTVDNHPLRPRHLQSHSLFADPAACNVDLVNGRRLLLGNSDVRLSYVVAEADSPLYRNGLGDECVYIEFGTAIMESVFGSLAVGPGDYVIVPTATTHRWLPTGDTPVRAYCIEANSHIVPPKRYLSRFGQLLEHAPYCERDLRAPAEPLTRTGEHVKVYLKHRGSVPGGIVGTVLTYPTHPFDVVGWDGCLYPYAFNIADFEPITGRVHQPPPVHQVFEGHNFVVCNFVPRKVDYHPLAVPVPYYHSNVDSDEVMFYCGGDYEARKGSGIGQGSISLHPGGHAHGPGPGTPEASLGAEFFDELAVMVDTFRPLGLGEGALDCEDPAYAWSWNARRDGGAE